jgi:hypothetical protein
MVELGLAVDVGRHLLMVNLTLLLIHLGLILSGDLSSTLMVPVHDLTATVVILTDLCSGITVVLLDSRLAGTAAAGTNLSVELKHIIVSRHRYREDKG